jgi:hypothetical protein
VRALSKWWPIAVLTVAGLVFASLGACCVAAIIPEKNRDPGLQEELALFGWILLPLWLGLLFLTLRQIVLIWRDRD